MNRSWQILLFLSYHLNSKNMKYRLHYLATCLFIAMSFISCSDDEVISNQPILEQPEQLTELIAQYNTNISAYQAMMDNKAEIVDYITDSKGFYKLQLSNQLIVDANAQATEDKDIPLLSIDEDGYWNYLLGGTSAVLTDLQGNPAPALSKTGKGIFTPQIALGKDGYWQVSYNGAQWKRLGNNIAPSLAEKTAANFSYFR